MIEKLSLQPAPVLPGVPNERDSCIQRLTDNLSNYGLERFRVVMDRAKCAIVIDHALETMHRTCIEHVRNGSGTPSPASA